MREKQMCVLCETRPATRKGEHVWPQWYLRHRLQGPGPFPWSINGEPILDREGRPVAPRDLVRVKLPTCRQDNGVMNQRFEVAAKAALRRLFGTRGLTVLQLDEIHPVALWLMKTQLLLMRPEVKYAHERIDPHAIRWPENEVPHAFYDWLVDGQPPPPGISLWMFRADERRDDNPPPSYRIPLPTIDADGSHIDVVCSQVTMYGVQSTLVVHPGWAIRHPLEDEGTATRLWPNPLSSSVNLAALPALPRNAVSWVRYRVSLKPGVLGSPDLPPIEHAPNVLGILPAMAPFIQSWGF